MGKREVVRRRFNIGLINELNPGDIVYDDRVPNLAVRVSPKGRRTFFVLGAGGERATIGPFPRYTIEMARKAAKDINLQFAVGTSPRKQKLLRQHRETEEMNFGDVWEDYRSHRARKRPNSKSATVDSQWNAHLSRWKDRKLSELTIDEVRPFFLKLRKHKPVTANRVQRQGKAMVNHATNELKWEGKNPFQFAQASEIGMERDRAVSRSELARLFEALDQLSNQTLADVFRMCIYTGQRVGNVLNMRFSEIDFDEGVWRFGNTKQGARHSIVLPTIALELLGSRERSSDWVFPGKVKGRPLAKGGYRKAWEQVKEKANLEDLNVHDLRSVHATQSLESAVIGQIQQQLGHATPEMTERYLRPVAEAKRAMLDAALASALSKSL